MRSVLKITLALSSVLADSTNDTNSTHYELNTSPEVTFGLIGAFGGIILFGACGMLYCYCNDRKFFASHSTNNSTGQIRWSIVPSNLFDPISVTIAELPVANNTLLTINTLAASSEKLQCLASSASTTNAKSAIESYLDKSVNSKLMSSTVFRSTDCVPISLAPPPYSSGPALPPPYEQESLPSWQQKCS